MKVNILNKLDANYPKSLIDMSYTPDIYMLGKHALPTEKVITFVGTRRPTPYGVTVTEQLINGLAGYSVIIMSGLALGIDALAHRMALKNELRTVAVVPSTVTDIYPRTNQGLAQQIIKNDGLILSLEGDRQRPHQGAFHKRNQLIAALSDVIVVVEAAISSGTMITTRHGLDMGKTILVVPGRINDVMSSGCNYLISQGAIPVLSTNDILQAAGLTPVDQALTLDPSDELIISKVGLGIEMIDDIISATGLDQTELAIKLSDLEIRGVINIEAGRVFLKGLA